jgi:hypothetical protein
MSFQVGGGVPIRPSAAEKQGSATVAPFSLAASCAEYTRQPLLGALLSKRHGCEPGFACRVYTGLSLHSRAGGSVNSLSGIGPCLVPREWSLLGRGLTRSRASAEPP